jgi:hypothetical protein
VNAELTEIVCVIDRSGSMEGIRSDAIGGYNSFLQGQGEEPGTAKWTLVLFDHEYERVLEGVPIESVPPLDNQSYVPRGTTALLDAIGRTVDDVGKRLAQTPEAERPSKVIVAILTDGLENASKDYTRPRIAQMIEHQQNVYSWEFVFLAANQDAIATANTLAIPAANAMNFAATGAGTRQAFAQLNESVLSRRRGGRGGDKG